MNRKNTIVAGFLGASAVFFGVAHAQGPGCDGDGRPGMRHSSMQRGGQVDPGARIEQRLIRLKSELKLNAQQEPLWQAFAEKSQAEAGKGAQAMRERLKDDKQISAPERLTQTQALLKERLAAMEAVNESFGRLYAGLTAEQKAVADKHFSAAGRHRHGPGVGEFRRQGPGAPGSTEPRKG